MIPISGEVSIALTKYFRVAGQGFSS
jgi:hypothetical protein